MEDLMDENEFFRQATLRICGSLDIEKGLQECFNYLVNYIPADIAVQNRTELQIESRFYGDLVLE